MDNNRHKIKTCIINNNDRELVELLSSGLDPNFEGGWPIRLAARYGRSSIVKTFIHYGANPHLLANSGASTLQLAVFSGKHWDTDKWTLLLSCCDSSQLADGAAVAIVFHNIEALKKILETGRCNTNIPTTLTGKTIENLAKGYKLHYLLNVSASQDQQSTSNSSPRISRQNRMGTRMALSPQQTPQHSTRNLSPSVAMFFHQTANQPSLTSPRNTSPFASPTTGQMLN